MPHGVQLQQSHHESLRKYQKTGLHPFTKAHLKGFERGKRTGREYRLEMDKRLAALLRQHVLRASPQVSSAKKSSPKNLLPPATPSQRKNICRELLF